MRLSLLSMAGTPTSTRIIVTDDDGKINTLRNVTGFTFMRPDDTDEGPSPFLLLNLTVRIEDESLAEAPEANEGFTHPLDMKD
jgi:hypothetical protein